VLRGTFCANQSPLRTRIGKTAGRLGGGGVERGTDGALAGFDPGASQETRGALGVGWFIPQIMEGSLSLGVLRWTDFTRVRRLGPSRWHSHSRRASGIKALQRSGTAAAPKVSERTSSLIMRSNFVETGVSRLSIGS